MSKRRRSHSHSNNKKNSSDTHSVMIASLDSFSHEASGKGTSRDKLSGIHPNANNIQPSSARQFKMSNGFISNIIDVPPMDMVKNWITLKTNRDNDDRETGLEGLGISRLIINRMDELNLRARLVKLLEYERLYNLGGLLYWGIKCDIPQFDNQLSQELPREIHKIDFVNVIEADRFNVHIQSTDPLSKNYHNHKFWVYGTQVHNSRVEWLVNDFMADEIRGISVLEKILEAIYAQDIALWSVTTNLFESSAKVFKSKNVDLASPKVLSEYMRLLSKTLSTQSFLPITEGDEISRIANTGNSDSNLADSLNHVFDVLSGLSRMPKSKILGQEQGALTAGQYDLISYYDDCSRQQESKVRPIIEKAIQLIIRERDGEIFKKLGVDVNSLDWEFTFNPLWKLNPLEEAQMKLQLAQTDQIYITAGVVSPSTVTRMRFADLEEFEDPDENDDSNPYNLEMPELPVPDPLANKANMDTNGKSKNAF
ncbi:MAG: DUF1073 domain-containing protein [Leptospira sp.]|nr:DUF1073 domain-containing protein [Leptospira sp.]